MSDTTAWVAIVRIHSTTTAVAIPCSREEAYAVVGLAEDMEWPYSAVARVASPDEVSALLDAARAAAAADSAAGEARAAARKAIGTAQSALEALVAEVTTPAATGGVPF